MREDLLKKRYGIPAALLILLVSAGIATAALVWSHVYTTTTREPLSFERINNLDIKNQGEPDDIIVKVTNASRTTGYGIFVDANVEDGQFESITYSSKPANKLVSTEQDEGNVNNDGDRWDARYNIAAGETYKIVVTVDSADDADPGELKVALAFHRQGKY